MTIPSAVSNTTVAFVQFRQTRRCRNGAEPCSGLREKCAVAFRPIALCCWAVLFSGLTAPASAQSLWQNRTEKWSYAFSDLRARAPGDLLVVTIDQSTDVQNKDQRLLNKQGESSSSADANFGFTGVIGTATGGLQGDHATAAQRKFNGDTQFKSERDFIDRFTVTIVDALPNGNLLVAGKRRVTLDGDTRMLTLTGVVRSVDVSPANTISSRMISQLEIQYESDGTESKFLNQGWLGRRLNRKWPF